jgi:extracellular factor (EF) 3-hydroxypalmitic acid methyl ester biosynthesis protein
MDAVFEQLQNGSVYAAMSRLQAILTDQRRRLARSDWMRFIAEQVMGHRVRDVVHADPFTYRAYSKPRGYAGDAVMMDYIYGYPRPEITTLPETAGRVFEFATATAGPAAVRFRRRLIAETIDVEAARLGRPIDVVAVAAGHLRETDLSFAVRNGQASVIALDQDEESLAVVDAAYARYGVRPAPASVRNIIGGRLPLPASDLSYSAGLYDYLPESAATRLTTVMFEALRPGGTLLVANFLPDILDAGYMESLMDWHLIYRTDKEMLALAGGVPTGDVAALAQFHDPFDNITFLRITKRA